MSPDPPDRVRLGAVFLVTCALLVFEVSLTRVFAIGHWGHLAPLVIAVALTGFGAAGSVAAAARPSGRRLHAWGTGATLALAALIPLGLLLAGRVPLNLPALAWQRVELVHLALYAGILVLPFFAGALYVTVSLMRRPDRAGQIYGADLLGSGTGAAAAYAVLQAGGPQPALALAAGLAAAGLGVQTGGRRGTALALAAAAVAVPGAWLGGAVEPAAYKPLALQRLERGASVLLQTDSANSRLTVLESPGQHGAPGLSIQSGAGAPPQWGLFTDGDQRAPLLLEDPAGPGPVVLERCLGAGAYRLASASPRVLVLEPRGNWDVWTARRHGARRILAVSGDAGWVDLLGGAAGGIRDEGLLPEGTALSAQAPRRFLHREGESFDLLFLPVASVTEGSASTHEEYLLTTEAFAAMLDRLAPGGVLAVETQLGTVPNDPLRVVAVAAAALRTRGGEPAGRVMVLRDWQAALVLVAPEPPDSLRLASLTTWAGTWGFDAEHIPGAPPAPARHVLDGPPLGELVEAILEGPGATPPYPFDITPVTDDRPFFHAVFRWSAVGELRDLLGPAWMRVAGWGPLLALGAFGVLTVLAAGFLFLPLAAGGIRPGGARATAALLYFGALGFGFLFAEIAFLHRAVMLTGAVAPAASGVLGVMLVGAGCGSLARGARPPAARTMALLAVLLAAAIPVVPAALRILALGSGSFAAALVLSGAVLAAVAFLMGVPLPAGLARIRHLGPGTVAWAWAVNGFAGVGGALAAELLAPKLGLGGIALVAGACYLCAGVLYAFLGTAAAASNPERSG